MLLEIFKHRDVRKKAIFTVVMLLVIRLGSHITMPNVDATILSQSTEEGLLGMINMLSGGGLQQFSVLALGISPYITASIVIQLLAMDVIPSFTEWSKQGANGNKKLDTATRILTVVLAFSQAIVLTMAFQSQYPTFLRSTGWSTYIYIATVLTGGTMLTMWIADQITAKGIGNGTSLVIFSGIIASLPQSLYRAYEALVFGVIEKTDVATYSNTGLVKFLGVVVFYLLIIVFVIYVEQAVRKISIQYASSAGKGRASEVSHLPIKVNSAGVIPVIFAQSMLMVPLTFLSYWPTKWIGYNQVTWFVRNGQMTKPLGISIYLIMIVLFAFFYSNLQIDPEKISDDFKKSGAYIPGVRPGKDTQSYIRTVLNRLTVVGAIFLVFLSALPLLIDMFKLLPGVTLTLGGTSMIIAVGVALETTKQVNNQLKKKSYQGFIRK